jgi:hypothetical protein
MSPSGTGVQVSLFGLLGVLAGVEEGVELNLLSLGIHSAVSRTENPAGVGTSFPEPAPQMRRARIRLSDLRDRADANEPTPLSSSQLHMRDPLCDFE